MSFFATGGAQPERPGAWQDDDAAPRVPLAPGITTRPVVGADVMLTHVHWEPGAVAPAHAHVEEQLLLVLAGAVEFTIGDDTRRMGPGDAVVIPPWVRHGGRALDAPVVTAEAFSPPRAALLDLLG